MDGWTVDHSVKSSVLIPVRFFFPALLYLHISAERSQSRFVTNIIFLFVRHDAFPIPIQLIYPSCIHGIISPVSIHCILSLCISYLPPCSPIYESVQLPPGNINTYLFSDHGKGATTPVGLGIADEKVRCRNFQKL